MARIEAVTLETKRLILRRRLDEDLLEMVEMLNNNSVIKYLGGYPPKDEHTILGIIRHRQSTNWHIIGKENNEFIGECGLNKIIDNYLGEVSYILNERFWGKGIGYEAMNKVIDHSFKTLKLGKLFAVIDSKNKRSINLIKRLNFSHDADIKEADFGGRVADISYYSLKNKV